MEEEEKEEEDEEEEKEDEEEEEEEEDEEKIEKDLEVIVSRVPTQAVMGITEENHLITI